MDDFDIIVCEDDERQEEPFIENNIDDCVILSDDEDAYISYCKEQSEKVRDIINQIQSESKLDQKQELTDGIISECVDESQSSLGNDEEQTPTDITVQANNFCFIGSSNCVEEAVCNINADAAVKIETDKQEACNMKQRLDDQTTWCQSLTGQNNINEPFPVEMSVNGTKIQNEYSKTEGFTKISETFLSNQINDEKIQNNSLELESLTQTEEPKVCDPLCDTVSDVRIKTEHWQIENIVSGSDAFLTASGTLAIKEEPEPRVPQPVEIEPEPSVPLPVEIEPEPRVPQPVEIEPEPSVPLPIEIEPEPSVPLALVVETDPSVQPALKVEPDPDTSSSVPYLQPVHQSVCKDETNVFKEDYTGSVSLNANTHIDGTEHTTVKEEKQYPCTPLQVFTENPQSFLTNKMPNHEQAAKDFHQVLSLEQMTNSIPQELGADIYMREQNNPCSTDSFIANSVVESGIINQRKETLFTTDECGLLLEEYSSKPSKAVSGIEEYSIDTPSKEVSDLEEYRINKSSKAVSDLVDYI